MDELETIFDEDPYLVYIGAAIVLLGAAWIGLGLWVVAAFFLGPYVHP